MMTHAHSKRMVVISDLHLGNPFSQTRTKAVDFLRWAARQDFDICINGDGLEIAQASFTKLAVEIPDVIRVLKELNKMGKTIYYIVGNHDIALEHFLEDWGALKVCPFLNVTSGDSRIRIEHGHLYDPFFVAYPRLYEFCTRLGGVILAIAPEAYRLWISFERWRARLRARRTGIIGEPPQFAEAALELSRRGFDSIVFGHTHHLGQIELPTGQKYFNPGSWLLSCHYVEIDQGRVSLKNWEEAV